MAQALSSSPLSLICLPQPSGTRSVQSTCTWDVLGTRYVGTRYIASFAAQKAVGASGVNKQNVSAPCPLFALG